MARMHQTLPLQELNKYLLLETKDHCGLCISSLKLFQSVSQKDQELQFPGVNREDLQLKAD